MKINVGDYVRTKDGDIAKIIKIKEYKNKKNEYYFDWEIDQYEDASCKCNMLYLEELKGCKLSQNIIDLIEIGDYVNGEKVCATGENSGDIYIRDLQEFILAKDIKSIVTREQFSQMEYRINE